jgi:hypothetical protein
MGEPEDMETRVASMREDTAARRGKVAEARKLIYESGYVVNSDKVEELLKEESWVPTEVISCPL